MKQRYTRVIQTVDGTQREFVFPNTVAATVTKLSKLWPLPSMFFYTLRKAGVAQYTDPNTQRVFTISVVEYIPGQKEDKNDVVTAS